MTTDPSYPPAARLLSSSASHYPSSRPDTYIYNIIPVLNSSSPSLALITSADELLILNRTTLRNQGGSLQGVPTGVTGLVGVDGDGGNVVAASGRDGKVVVWDLRRGVQPVGTLEMDQRMPVTALASGKEGLDIAAGTELASQQAVITIWDSRTSKPRWQSTESHNDDITDLQFHPSLPDHLLSGSTDGLVSVFDTTIQDEDDALKQVINHGSIHRAGFLSNDAIYALSHDEQFSVHPFNTTDEEAVEPQPIVMGDLRAKVGCDYVIDVLRSGEGNIVATGTHSGEPKIDLIPVGANPSWSLQDTRKVSLADAHGEEIVRTIYVDDEMQAIYTGGEDGEVKMWKMSEVRRYQYSSAKDPVSNHKVKDFREQWVINGFLLPSEDPASHDQQFNADSVSLVDGFLQLKQLAYTQADALANNPVNIAGIQTKTLDMLHGSFRTVFKITGATGGSVGSFFWYHNDSSEVDVEIVTKGDSIVNNTINYTSHPSLYPDGQPIPNATLSVPFTGYESFHTHRFDCTSETATYYLDDVYMHQDHHNVPHYPGSLQLNLWANGNALWSGIASTTDVTMTVRLIEVYYNTSEADDGTDSKWSKICRKAGGPSNETICLEGETMPIASMSATQTSAVVSSTNTEGSVRPTRTGSSPTTGSTNSPMQANRAASREEQVTNDWVVPMVAIVVIAVLSY